MRYKVSFLDTGKVESFETLDDALRATCGHTAKLSLITGTTNPIRIQHLFLRRLWGICE